MARNKRKPNAVANTHAIQQRQPRFNVRGQLLQNTMISGNRSIGALSTDPSGFSGGIYYLDGKDGGYDPVGAVSTFYNTFKYLPGTSFTYSPSVGLNTPGTVFICYITNPELMVYLEGLVNNATFTTLNDRVRAVGNCKSGPLWAGFSVPMDTSYRRSKFDVNAAYSLNVDTYDRSIQGAFVVSIIGGPASTAICRNTLHKKIQLFELQGTGAT